MVRLANRRVEQKKNTVKEKGFESRAVKGPAR